MNFTFHQINHIKVAELISDAVVIKTADDAVDLIGNLYYEDLSKVIVHEKNLTSDFFDLKNKIAGEVLQKFSNYRMQIIIIGDFSKFTSKSMIDFIYESNKGRQVSFVKTLEEALSLLAK